MKHMPKAIGGLSVGLFCFFTFSAGDLVQAASQTSGEALFKTHCAICHPNGGNIAKPTRTLSKKNRVNSGLKTENDLIKYMRKPGEQMPAFDKNKLPDKDAKAVAAYIIKTFK